MPKPKIEQGPTVVDDYGVHSAVIIVEGKEICTEYAEDALALRVQIAESHELYINLYKATLE